MNGSICISEATSLALHSMVLIAEKDEGYASAKEIVKYFPASQNHLAKILQRLSKAGLINALRGPSGGYTLAKNKTDISLLDVYEAVEGPFRTGACPLGREVCPFKSCIFSGILTKANSDVKEYLRNKKLSEV
jgi:Rrf2 family protein